ncbi:hypothetical protein ACU4GI_19795 [Cupriavidus basilensis]
MSLRSTLAARSYEPGAWINEIERVPALMIVATHDEITVTEIELDAYERAAEPKQLEMIEGGHFPPYSEQFPVASRVATGWFRKHLNSVFTPLN